MNKTTAIKQFQYIHLEVTMTSQKGGRLNKHKTSMIRGIIGRLLKNNVCHDFNLLCSNCEFINTCVYPALFESPDKLVNKLGRGGTVPHPYIIRCHDERNNIHEGDLLSFDLILLGNRSEIFTTYLLHVFENFDQYSFGKDKVIFSVSKVEQRIKDKKKLIMDDRSIVKPEIESFSPDIPTYNKILVQFKTPCRMMRNGKAMNKITLREFLWQIDHRIHHLEVLNNLRDEYDKTTFEYPPEETMKLFKVEWDEVLRYSLRQNQPVKLGGIMATFELTKTPVLDQWIPAILFAEKFHIGKATTFGLGQYELWFK